MSQQDHPSYFDEKYFEKILKQNFKNSSIQVKNLRVEPCGAGRDGFLSELYRVFIRFHMNSIDETTSFVIKLASSQEVAAAKIGPAGHNVQNKEMDFYEIIAPQLEKVLKKIGEKKVFTKVVIVDREHEAIIFEDLLPQGFAMAPKYVGIDDKKMKISLKKLASFHAASMILYEKHPKAFDNFTIGMFSRKIDAFNGSQQSIFSFVVEEVSTWPGFEKYAEKLEKIKPNLLENILKCFDVNSGDFCALNHGDLWVNNLMFKTAENGETEDAIMVKVFQIRRTIN